MGVELLKFINKRSSNSPYNPKISLGAKFYETYLDFYGFDTSEKAVDMGFLLSARPLNNKLNPQLGIDLDISIGYSIINLQENELQFRIDDDGDGLVNEDPIDQLDNDEDGLIDEDTEEIPIYMEAGKRLGVAAKLSLPLARIISKENQKSLRFSENIASVMIIIDKYKSTYRNQTNQSTGMEISLLDIISYRCSLNNSSYGFGFNMDLTKHWSLQANMASTNDNDANSYDVGYRYKF